MRFLQKIGKSLMIPISCMPICGILMGIGYLLCPAGMQGGEIVGIAAKIGFFLITAGSAVIDHIPILFAIGVGVGMSDGEGNGGIAALISWLMMTTLLSEKTLAVILPSLAETETIRLALSKIENPFIGILAGVIGALCVRRFQHIRLPAWLSFFSGKRLGIIMAGLVSIAVSAVLFGLWPLLFSGLVWFGRRIAEMGNFGSAVYATLNRLLIPFGLHHALNNVFWFDTIGLGDLTAFWASKTSADVSWSVGMYMSGFFPSMMFGIPAAALAMRLSFKKKDKRAAGMLFSSALAAFVCGVTEPFEFAFMFASPALYVIYCILFGVFTFITNAVGFRAGFSFSAGIIDLIFSASLPAAQKTLLIIPLGIAAFAVYFVVFKLMIGKFDLKTPGREDTANTENNGAPLLSSEDGGDRSRAAGIIAGLGGKDNIVSVSNCATRLRVEVKDSAVCNDEIIKKAGAVGVMRTGKTSVQVIIGMDVEFVAEDVNRLLRSGVPVEPECQANAASVKMGNTAADALDGASADKLIGFEEIGAPADGVLVPMEEIPDEVFAGGVLGKCVGIIPDNGNIYAPCSGTVTMVAESLHAIGICSDSGHDVLVHVGINTVTLGGKGFACKVRVGDRVTKNEPMMTADLNRIRAAGLNTMVITAVSDGD